MEYLGNISDSFSSLSLFILASVIISISSGLGMSAAFNGNPITVYLSFVTFVAGYKIAQTGYHNGKESYKIFIKDIGNLYNYKTSFISFLGGSLFSSLGFVLLGKAVIKMSITLGLSAGIVIGGGYILAHWAVNNRLV